MNIQPSCGCGRALSHRGMCKSRYAARQEQGIGWTTARIDDLKRLYPMHTIDEIARQFGAPFTRNSVVGKAKRLGLSKREPREGRKQHSQRPTDLKARFLHEPVTGVIRNLRLDNPAFTEKRTIYPSTVLHESKVKNALKSGVNAAKIGGVIMKGKWKGFPVFTLTLEERATCPTSCAKWKSCYGNAMQWAERLQPGPDLEWRLERELGWYDLQHRKGFAVRLHLLGEFYSVEYVNFWMRMLHKFKALHVFGFSARWDVKRDPIAAVLVPFVRYKWDRFAIRFSDAPFEDGATRSIEHPIQNPEGSTVCPQQLGLTQGCGTCGYCFNTKRNVSFIGH